MAVVWCTHIFAEVSLTMEARTFLSAQSRASLFVGSGCRCLTLGSSRLASAAVPTIISGYSSQHNSLDAGLLYHALETLGYCVSEDADPRNWSHAEAPRRSRGVATLRLDSAATQSCAPYKMYLLGV